MAGARTAERHSIITGMARLMVLLFAIQTLSAAPARTQGLYLIPKLRDGDELRLQLTHTRQLAGGASSMKAVSSIDLEVVSASSDGFVLDWVTGDTAYETGQAAVNPAAQSMTAAMKGMRLRVA